MAQTRFTCTLKVWMLTTNCLRTADDFRQVVVDYAAEAAAHRAVYIEGIFSPAERIQTGVSWDALFNGYCDGAQQAEEEHGVIVRLTPDLYWGIDPDDAVDAARRAAAFRDRGVVGFGTDLGQEYGLLPRMGINPRQVYQAAAQGALCDEGTRSKITAIGERTVWPGL
jgi:aminodeoxyfutalosine deaminase